jgi:hypothetical protein
LFWDHWEREIIQLIIFMQTLNVCVSWFNLIFGTWFFEFDLKVIFVDAFFFVVLVVVAGIAVIVQSELLEAE